MQFPEITTWANNIVALLQIIGGAIIIICIALYGLMFLTSFGNEHRIALIRSAAVTLVIGLFVLFGAGRIGAILQSLVTFLH